MIAAVDARTTAVGRLLRAPLLAGRQFDWTKPPYNPVVALGEFQTDRLACLRIARTPPGAEPVFVTPDLYRACLKSKGWGRVTGATAGTPPRLFRGQEDEGPVALDQTATAGPRHELARALHARLEDELRATVFR